MELSLVQAFLILHDNAPPEMVGNRTECALLLLLRTWGVSYKDIRDAHANDLVYVYGFSSDRKMASVLLKHQDGSHRLYCKVRSFYHAPL